MLILLLFWSSKMKIVKSNITKFSMSCHIETIFLDYGMHTYCAFRYA